MSLYHNNNNNNNNNNKYIINNLLFEEHQLMITQDDYDAAYVTGILTKENKKVGINISVKKTKYKYLSTTLDEERKFEIETEKLR